MKKQRVLALLLGLTLLCTAVIPSVFAADGDSSNNGMVINKTATANNDGSYTIQLEAYATGSKIITEVTEDIPTDIVLVLDQSGSMDALIGTVSFEPYEDKNNWLVGTTYHTRNQDYYEVRANGDNPNLYYPLGDGSYASVSVQLDQNVTYTEITNGRNNSTQGGATNYWENRNNLYALVGGQYQQVTVTRTSSDGTYTYKIGDVVIATSDGRRGQPKFTGTDDGYLYVASADTSKNVYTYTYTDAEGVLQTIGTSTGATTRPTFGENNTAFYQKVIDNNAGGSRLNALKTAVTTFANNVAQKAKGADGELGTEDDVNHRVAVVGFATGDYTNNSDYPTYENTELFIGATQYNYNEKASSYYGSAFQDMNTQAGYNNVIASKDALAARGATYINYGMMMANGIFAANPLEEGEQRNRVVVVFTDGVPGYSSYDSTVASSAITEANTTKTNYGATVYTVGIFTGADATSADNANGTDTQKANWFMQNLSSNNGTPQNPSYYLSAADADTLKNIFQQISDQIESGGSSTTLSSVTVIKDIIAPAFTLPEGASASDITLETYACTGKSGDAYTWSKNDTAIGATATVSGDQVSVTGFDFAENYVGTVTSGSGTTYRGNKLVISFTVKPKSGFLGGNNVYTNTNAGVYENSSATNPVMTFPQPQVNVPIGDVTVGAADKNVYLLGGVTAAQLKEGATVTVGGVSLDLTADNCGLEPWQTEYVDISVKYYDADGETEITDLSNLTDDTTYTVEVTVTPKSNGEGASGTPATAKSGNNAGNVNVFKPELTFKDSEVYYGDTVTQTELESNLTGTKWLHNGTEADTTTMGTAPALTLEYSPNSGTINTKQDIPVDVTVKIDAADVTVKTTFAHNNCEGKTCTVPNGYEFLLHVKTCQLTVTKSGGVDGEPYVFTVYKDGEAYTEVTVVGNGSETICELPVGTYTIEEDTGWSWRFNPDYSNGVTLSKANTAGTITCTNSTSSTKWLNGFSAVVTNIFGVKH